MSHGNSRRRSVIAAVLAVTAAFMTAAAPAGAWLRDFSSSQALTATNSDSPKSLEHGCPGAKFAIGAGATVPQISNLALNKVWNLFGQRETLAAAAETDSDSARWALTARVYCAEQTGVRPAVATTAAPYIKDVEIVRNQSSSNSNSPKSVLASCPAGKSSIGGGYQIEGSNEVAAYSVQRTATALRARAHETDATGQSWSVEAHAICANISTAVNTATYAGGNGAGATVSLTGPEGNSPTNSLNKSVTATCPAGTFVVGGGANVRGTGVGEPPAPADVAITVSRPGGDGTPSNTWTASAVEVDATGASWQLKARAVCTRLDGLPLP